MDSHADAVIVQRRIERRPRRIATKRNPEADWQQARDPMADRPRQTSRNLRQDPRFRIGEAVVSKIGRDKGGGRAGPHTQRPAQQITDILDTHFLLPFSLLQQADRPLHRANPSPTSESIPSDMQQRIKHHGTLAPRPDQDLIELDLFHPHRGGAVSKPALRLWAAHPNRLSTGSDSPRQLKPFNLGARAQSTSIDAVRAVPSLWISVTAPPSGS